MSERGFPATWRDPEYLAGIVGTIATGALFFYTGTVESTPTPETVGFVLLWVLLPAVIAHEAARQTF